MKKLIYIANWKSYFTYNQSITWLKQHDNDLNELTKNNSIILCPDFLTLAAINVKKSSDQSIQYGAQNCSPFPAGAYTGEIPAQSISEIGVTYCIVGHSERRRLFYETLDDNVSKINMLLMYSITPIICVSEDYKNELRILLPGIKNTKQAHLIIAYEPISAIGTGITPSSEKITAVLAEIKHDILHVLPHFSYSLIYGGSVSFSTASALKKIPLLDGFLIGKASTDFQELKKIVASNKVD